MNTYSSTIVLRHRKENLKKCSLRNLESRQDFIFFRYPLVDLPELKNYIMLDLNAPILSPEDANFGLLIIDGTWRYAEKMTKFVEQRVQLMKRSLPSDLRTAYPRVQGDCPDPERGLASIEAVYAAYHLLGRDTKGLLDHYYWKEDFLNKNPSLI